MATQTTNYGLVKDAGTDYYNVNAVNANLDIVDAEIKKASDRADSAFQSASNGKVLIKNAITGVDGEVTVPSDATFQQLADCIGQISTGVDTMDATATAAQILTPATAYVKELKVTGTMPNRGSIGTQNLTTDSAEYVIPIGYHNGLGKVKAVITNLIASVVKAGVTVGGILGTFTSDATAIASQMLAGVTAYVNGVKITGTITSKTAQTYSPSTVAQTIASGQHLTGAQTIAATTGTAVITDVLAGKTFNSANGIGLVGTAVAGKGFSTGVVTGGSAAEIPGTIQGGSGGYRYMNRAIVSGLSFKPSVVILTSTVLTNVLTTATSAPSSTYEIMVVINTGLPILARFDGTLLYMVQGGFSVPVSDNIQYTWKAWE